MDVCPAGTRAFDSAGWTANTRKITGRSVTSRPCRLSMRLSPRTRRVRPPRSAKRKIGRFSSNQPTDTWLRRPCGPRSRQTMTVFCSGTNQLGPEHLSSQRPDDRVDQGCLARPVQSLQQGERANRLKHERFRLAVSATATCSPAKRQASTRASRSLRVGSAGAFRTVAVAGMVASPTAAAIASTSPCATLAPHLPARFQYQESSRRASSLSRMNSAPCLPQRIGSPRIRSARRDSSECRCKARAI